MTTAVCLAERGFDTVCVDLDLDKLDRLAQGFSVIGEPDLADALRAGLEAGTLRRRCR